MLSSFKIGTSKYQGEEISKPFQVVKVKTAELACEHFIGCQN